MIDLTTDKVILAKPVRRKGFILGKSVALVRTEAAVMDDGTLRVNTERRAEFFPNAPLKISWQSFRWRTADEFPELVKWLRDMEADYITAELPEEI